MKIWKEFRKRLGKEVWIFEGYVEGVRYREAGFESKREAEETVAALRVRARNIRLGLETPDDPVTLAELVEERVRDFDLTKKHHRRNKVVLEQFRDFFPRTQLVARLMAADVLAFKRARLRESALRPNAINRELECVAAMFNSAGRYFPALETWRHPRMPYERVPAPGRERVITREEARRLLEELRQDLRRGEKHRTLAVRLTVADIFEVMLYTGMRGGEVLRLGRSWLDEAEQLLRIPAHVTKTRRAREVPLNAGALAVLRRRAAEGRHPRLLYTNAAGGALDPYQMRRTLAAAARAVGVDYGRGSETGFTLHDARHTAATTMLHGGADIASVRDVLGHSDSTMTLRYSHSTLDSKRRAVDALGASTPGQGGDGR